MKRLSPDGSLEVPFACAKCLFVAKKRQEILVAQMRERKLIFSIKEIEESVPGERMRAIFRSNGIEEELVPREWELFRSGIIRGMQQALRDAMDSETCALSDIRRATEHCDGLCEQDGTSVGDAEYRVFVCGSPQNEQSPNSAQDLVIVIPRNEDQN